MILENIISKSSTMNANLDDMALFVAIVRAGSFHAASEHLGMPIATLSRRFAAFEKALNFKLLNRNTRTMHLTEIGAVYFEKTQKIIDDAQFLNEEMQNNLNNPSGLLKISLPIDFSVYYLSPILIDFAREYPNIQFELNLNPNPVDLLSEQFDLAIRIGKINNPNLILHYAFDFKAQCFASPNYLKNKPEIKTPDDLKNHDCILFLKQNKWRLISQNKTKEIAISSRFQVNHIGMLKRLALAGFGIILLPSFILKKEIENQTLIKILPEWSAEPREVSVISATRLLPAKVRVFLDFLKNRLQRDFPRST